MELDRLRARCKLLFAKDVCVCVCVCVGVGVAAMGLCVGVVRREVRGRELQPYASHGREGRD